MTPSPSSILRSAADLIEPEGKWTRGNYWVTPGGLTSTDLEAPDTIPAEAGCFCVMGAIARVSGVRCDDARETPAGQALMAALDDPVLWNDRPRRKQAEVVAKLREVADKLDAEASSPSRDHAPSAGDPLDGGV